MKQIIDFYDIGFYIQSHQPLHIAEVITRIFMDEKRYAEVKANTLKAKAELCWELEEKVLMGVVNCNLKS